MVQICAASLPLFLAELKFFGSVWVWFVWAVAGWFSFFLFGPGFQAHLFVLPPRARPRMAMPSGVAG